MFFSVHEVESLYCLPGVVSAIAKYLQKTFDEGDYLARLRQGVSVTERHKVILERWKRRIEPRLIGVVASVHTRTDSLSDIVDSLPQLFDAATWDFSPAGVLEEEKLRIERAVETGTIDDVLRLLPGKARIAAAAQYVGQQPDDFINLVNTSLLEVEENSLGSAIQAALNGALPSRAVAQEQPSPQDMGVTQPSGQIRSD